jgi:hypothetical protein
MTAGPYLRGGGGGDGGGGGGGARGIGVAQLLQRALRASHVADFRSIGCFRGVPPRVRRALCRAAPGRRRGHRRRGVDATPESQAPRRVTAALPCALQAMPNARHFERPLRLALGCLERSALRARRRYS